MIAEPSQHQVELIATALFALAVLHTFSVKRFQHLASRYPDGSVGENFWHMLGEVEIAFGIWAGVLVAFLFVTGGVDRAAGYLESLNFTEPTFVFVIMTIAATRPVLHFANLAIAGAARLVPLPREVAFFVAVVTLGPLLGSFITEPAAMTVTALILREHYFDRISVRAKYLTLGALFVNVSIGGVLTHFAAPPVLMVADTWNWGVVHMATHFGWKAAIAVVLNTALVAGICYKELRALRDAPFERPGPGVEISPVWLMMVHVAFLALVVVTAHHAAFFMGLFLFFLGVTTITQEYQDALKLREALLVAFFLAGLIVLGGLQEWWLAPLITRLDALPLFLGTTALTAFTDNAALTYLGSQVPNVSDVFKYALVAGAVAGGGMTVIANAPNPAGFAILRESFGPEGISPLGLALAALAPTLIAMACLWFLPTL